MLRTFAIACGLACSLTGLASAEPVSLTCQASGAQGSVSFSMTFDEASQQASASWQPGGGRPTAPVFGEAGTDNSVQPSISSATVFAPFRSTMLENDPYAYAVQVDRNSGTVAVRMYRNSGSYMLSGSCQRIAIQRQF